MGVIAYSNEAEDHRMGMVWWKLKPRADTDFIKVANKTVHSRKVIKIVFYFI